MVKSLLSSLALLFAFQTLTFSQTDLWSRLVSGTSYQLITDLDADENGNVYWSGTTINNATYGSTNLTAYYYDAIFGKTNPDGSLGWIMRGGSTSITGAALDGASAVEYDGHGNVYVGGVFQGTGTFGNLSISSTSGSFDAFVLKLDTNGTVDWVLKHGGAGSSKVVDLAADSEGNLFVLSAFSGNVTVDTLSFTAGGTTNNFVVAKYDSTGDLLWAEHLVSGNSYVYSYNSLYHVNGGLEVDAADNLYVTGSFLDTINIGGSSISSTGSSNAYDAFICKMNGTSGATLWLSGGGGILSDYGSDIAIDGSNVYLIGTGYYYGMTFGSVNIAQSNNYNNFVIKYNPSTGAAQSGFTIINRYNSLYYGAPKAEFDEDGELVIAGTFATLLTYGSNTQTATGTAESYVLKYNPSSSSFTSLSVAEDAAYLTFNTSLVVLNEDDYAIGGWIYTLNGSHDWGNTSMTSSIYDGYIVKYSDCDDLVANAYTLGNQTIICDGNDLELFADTNSLYDYQWLYNGALISGEINETFTIDDAGNYSVVIDSAGCRDTSNIITVTVTSPPNVSHPNIPGVCDGDDPFVLSGGIPAGGTYSGSAITGGNTFDPGLAVLGNNIIYYTYTDSNGCADSVSKTVTVSQSPAIFTTSITRCEGDGPVTLSVAAYGFPTGGTHSGPGVTGNQFFPSVAGAGTHAIYYASSNGCFAEDSIVVTVTASPNVNLSAPSTACFSSFTPLLLTGTPSGGTFTWNSINSQLFYPSLAGSGNVMVTYTVTQNGCTAIDTGYVFVDTVPAVSISAFPTLCEGDDTLSLVPFGIPAGGNFSGTGVSSNVFNPVTSGSGTYTITYSYVNGCGTYTETESITVGPAPTVSFTSTNVSCYAGNNGSATASASGATSPYSFAWSSGSSAATANNLSAGAYTVTVSDDNGCEEIATITIAEPTELLVLTNSSSVSCSGGSNGAISAFPSGGTGPYTYAWSNGSNTSIVTGVAAGSYTVTVTDANSCTKTATAIVTQPSALLATISSSSNVSCNGGSNGSATASASGGTSPYNYAWSGGGTSATKSGLSAGTYTVTVTDANGCSDVETVTISQPAALVASIGSVTNVSCFGGSNGTATASASGGTAPFSYAWNGGGSSATKTGLSAGTHTVVITDANGCTDSETVTITQPATGVSASISSSTNVSCNGGNNGAATASANGGTGTKTFVWSTGATSASVTGLVAGSYIVTATDANGCEATASITVTQPSAVVAAIGSSTPPSCNGGSNGQATASATGGTSPYTFAWSGGGNTATKTGLAAGTYTVTATDANGCTDVETITISQPTAVVASISSSTNAACNGGSNGSATASAAGGTSPYTYTWSGGGTSATKTGLSAGTYSVTVTDANGCTDIESVTISEPTPIIASISTSSNVSCFGGSNGSATASGSGGTTPYSYAWSGGGSAASKTGLAAGIHTVTVTDANGCADVETITITQPASAVLVSVTSSTNVSCNGGNNGAATALASGGTGSKTYAWSNGATTASVTGLAAGTYTVSASDANGCVATTSVTITQPVVLGSPALARVNVSCNGGNNGALTANPTGGTAPYSYLWSTGGTGQSISGLAAGNYTVTITDANACSIVRTRTITQPAILNASISTVQPSCNGGSNGSATASSTGGTGSKTYVWSTGGTTAGITGLNAGSYTVTVTDANGCTDVESATVSEPTVVLAVISTSTNVGCFGGTNGAATASGSGGTSPYSFAWNGGGTAATKTGLQAGTHTVTVSDANGCNDIATVTITQPASAVDVTITASSAVSCNGGNDGGATANASGGTGAKTYLWSTGATTAGVTGLSAGSYTVTATDANGCTDITTVTITEPTVVVANISSPTQVSCNGGSNGSATASATGGTSPYTYLWSSGAISAAANGLSAGTYTVTITDANGCSGFTSTTITEPTAISVVLTGTNSSCNGANDGSVSAAVSGGTAGYSYLWSTLATGTSISGLVPGTYTLTVTDTNGCTDTASTTISEPSVLSATATATSQVQCNGENTGEASASATGGTSPYSYLWSTGSITNTASALVAGIYSITVTDNNGCTDIASVAITEPTVLVSSATVDSNTTCASSAVGVATAAASGGVTPYTYAWSNSNTVATATALGTGTYTVTVTDNNGCEDLSTISIVVQDTLLPVVTAQDLTVYLDGSGVATITATGVDNGSIDNCGIDTMYLNQYAFDCDDLGTPVSVILTVEDVNGNSASASATITIVDTLAPVVNANDLTVYLNPTGTVTLTAALLDNGTADNCGLASVYVLQSTFTCANAGAAYPVVLYATDASGNLGYDTAMVTVVDTIVPSLFTQNITLYLDAAGDAFANAGMVDLGSTDNCALDSMFLSQEDFDCSHLGVNSVDFTAVDVNGNSATTSVLITVLDTILPSVGATNLTVYLDGSGSAIVSAMNVATGVTDNCNLDQIWLNDSVLDCSDTGTVTRMLYAQDQSGNVDSVIFSITLFDTTAPAIQAVLDTTIYLNANGEATITALALDLGSDDNCAIASSALSQTLFDCGDLGLNNVLYTVVDVSGNASSQSIEVTVIDTVSSLTIAVDTTILCQGGNSGVLTASAYGINSGFSYVWSSGQLTATASNLPAGTYTVTATSAGGCQIEEEVTLADPGELSADLSAQDITCFGGTDGHVSVVVSGGTPGYTYSWSAGGTTDSIGSLATGTYTVTVTDANGCSLQLDTTLVSSAALTVQIQSSLTEQCIGDSSAVLTAIVAGGVGGYSFTWNVGGTFVTNDSVSNVSAGSYSLLIEDAVGCLALDTYEIALNQLPVLSFAFAEDTVCQGPVVLMDALVSPMGGVFSGASVMGDSLITDTLLGVQTISYSYTDTNGCSNQINEDVFVLPAAVVTLSSPLIELCAGSTQVLDFATPIGGTYTSPFIQNGLIVAPDTTYNGVGGTYAFNNACGSDVDTFYLSISPLPVVDLGEDTSLCNGTGWVFSAGEHDTYLWSTGDQTQAITLNVDETPITQNFTLWVQVANAQGCTSSDTLEVAVVDQPTFYLGDNLATCMDTVITLEVPNVYDSFVWSDGSTGLSTIAHDGTVVMPGAYQYWVLGSNEAGCSYADTILIRLEDCENEYVGVNEQPLQFHWSFYPNPAFETIHVVVGDQMDHVEHLVIYGALGEIVKRYEKSDWSTNGQGELLLNLGEMANGAYVLQVNHHFGQTSKRFIVGR